jgi:uncharacterized protein
MNVVTPNQAVEHGARSALAIADGDIHPSPKDIKDLYPYLEQRWRDHIDTYSLIPRQGFLSGPAYPKGQPYACRRDAVPPGGRPGTDLDFMRCQHLDPNHVALGILNSIGPHPGALQNMELAASLARAFNEWQVEHWTSRDARLRGSVVVPYEDAEACAAEIDHRSGDANFVQVLLLSRTAEPAGQKRYWPIYEAAARAGLPVGIHAFGFGGHAVTGSGWPSYYIEDMVGHAQSSQSLLTSMVIEGVFERFPTLRLVLIEAGFAWLPSLAWRLDRLWKRLKQETPHLRRLPSEVIRQHVWLTTQPMEEAQPRELVLDAIEWIGWDRLLFATDYPHWDYDDPAQAFPLRVPEEKRRALFLENACALYGAGSGAQIASELGTR